MNPGKTVYRVPPSKQHIVYAYTVKTLSRSLGIKYFKGDNEQLRPSCCSAKTMQSDEMAYMATSETSEMALGFGGFVMTMISLGLISSILGTCKIRIRKLSVGIFEAPSLTADKARMEMQHYLTPSPSACSLSPRS